MKENLLSLYLIYTQTTMALPLLNKYFSREMILKKLIDIRCNYAEKKQKKVVIRSLAIGDVQMPISGAEKFIYSIFPQRRRWIHVGREQRINKTPVEKNKRSLLLTVRREEKTQGEHPNWYIQLERYIEYLQQYALSPVFAFDKPHVTVIEKKRKKDSKTIECRPICSFKSLDERIIASIYNKVLTDVFDDQFYENSFAFRAHYDGVEQMSHLQAVRVIREFRRTNPGNLWVAECDMKKFYDTIDHDTIKQRVAILLNRCHHAGKLTTDEIKLLRRVVFSYVDCFSFKKDVYVYNSQQENNIWRNISNAEGMKKEIGWVEEEIKQLRKDGWPYRTKHHDVNQLGVPQGCALSGLIANVVMDVVDQNLKVYWKENPDFLYVRFCDDMIMIGVNRDCVFDAFEEYKNCIRNLHLFPHEDEDLARKKQVDFWKGKTRGPYKWGSPGSGAFPWITFVGYDMNWEADTRIRKSTLQKEVKKQYDKFCEVRNVFAHSGVKPRVSKSYIEASLLKRLISMSVGRVTIWNYPNFKNKYSWASAFTALTNNKWSRAQLRLLDRHRNKMMNKLRRMLHGIVFTGTEKRGMENTKGGYHPFYGKPFSYFMQVLK